LSFRCVMNTRTRRARFNSAEVAARISDLTGTSISVTATACACLDIRPIGEPPYETCRYSSIHTVIWNIASYYAVSTDYDVASDCSARSNHYVGSNPNIITDSDVPFKLPPIVFGLTP
jgi:hypothetical protein